MTVRFVEQVCRAGIYGHSLGIHQLPRYILSYSEEWRCTSGTFGDMQWDTVDACEIRCDTPCACGFNCGGIQIQWNSLGITSVRWSLKYFHAPSILLESPAYPCLNFYSLATFPMELTASANDDL